MNESNEAIFASYRRSLQAKNRSEETIGSYRKAMVELDAVGVTFVDATKKDIEAWAAKRLGEVASTTVAIRFRSLRAFFGWLTDEGEVAKNPMTGLTEPKVTTEAVEVLTDDELKALLKACVGKTFADRRDEALIRLWCEPGSPRLGEMAGLRVVDLDMAKDQIRVEGKTGERVVPFGAKTGQALDRYLRMRVKHSQKTREELWLGPKGAMTASGLAQALARRSEAAGMKRVHPHMLRHTSASVFLENGGSEGDAIQLFGWSDATMIHKVYGRSAAGMRAHKAARRLSLGDRL